jgi:hypothetical protein
VSIGQGLAVVRFNGGYEYAKWAKRRLDGEDVFGHRIFVKIPFLDASVDAGGFSKGRAEMEFYYISPIDLNR